MFLYKFMCLRVHRFPYRRDCPLSLTAAHKFLRSILIVRLKVFRKLWEIQLTQIERSTNTLINIFQNTQLIYLQICIIMMCVWVCTVMCCIATRIWVVNNRVALVQLKTVMTPPSCRRIFREGRIYSNHMQPLTSVWRGRWWKRKRGRNENKQRELHFRQVPISHLREFNTRGCRYILWNYVCKHYNNRWDCREVEHSGVRTRERGGAGWRGVKSVRVPSRWITPNKQSISYHTYERKATVRIECW